MTVQDAPRMALLDGHFYAADARPAYAWLRAQGGVWFDESCGLWGIASYDAVVEASTRPDVFSSAEGSRPTSRMPSMIDMDDPEHLARRQLVHRGFTPRRVLDLQDSVTKTCDEILDAVGATGSCDFVVDVAALLPIAVIADLLGVRPEDRAQLLAWSEQMLAGQGNDDPAVLEGALTAVLAYRDYILEVVADRRTHPRDDLISILVHAEVDGAGFDDEELVHESLLLLVGGDETARHVIAGGTEQLLRAPEHWHRLQDDRSALPTAVEEMLRWVSPIKNMNRTLTSDTVLAGVPLKAGDKALMLYESANFDERHFDRPEVFDPGRTPNDHLAFGFGPHFCLGSSLARMEIRTMLDRLLTRWPDLRLASDEPLPRRENAFISGVESMPVVFAPERQA